LGHEGIFDYRPFSAKLFEEKIPEDRPMRDWKAVRY